MKKNVGGLDRIVRLGLGSLLILVAVAGYAGITVLAVGPVPQALASVIVFLIGAVLVVTGLVQKCPLSRILGINTYRSTDSSEAGQRRPSARE